MIKVWSELPAARFREQSADLATLLWVVFWGNVTVRLFQFLAGFADVGRTLHQGGLNTTQSGRDLASSLRSLPVVGERVAGATQDAFAAVGAPLSDFGDNLATFILVVAVLLTLLFALVVLGPWLIRYVPWRWRRLRRVRAAHRAIRQAPTTSGARVEEVLALRAVTRLDYPTLLQFTPDPLGDWSNGRHDRLAQAELASVGLRRK